MFAKDLGRASRKMRATRASDRAAAYRLLSWFLLESPDVRFISEILDSGFESWLNSSDPPAAPMRDGLLGIRDFLAARQTDEQEKLCLELAVQWTRLFRGVAPGYGPRPPYEAIYRGEEGAAQAELLLDLDSLYSAAGAAISEGRAERLDHLGLELDVMRVLCSDESSFWAQGNVADAAKSWDLQRRLLREHLLSWAPAYCEVILSEAGVPFYHGVARALSALLDDDARSFGLPSKTAPTRRGL